MLLDRPLATKQGNSVRKLAMKVMLGRKSRNLGDVSLIRIILRKKLFFPFFLDAWFPVRPLISFRETKLFRVLTLFSFRRSDGGGKTFGEAFGKATLASGYPLPLSGTAFLSVKDADKEASLSIAQDLSKLGFSLVATRGTAKFLNKKGINAKTVNKVNEGRPHIVDHIKNGEIQLVVNTSALGVHEVGAAYELREIP